MTAAATPRRERTRRSLVFAVFLVALALLYTGYKAFGQAVDDSQRDWWLVGSFLPRSDDKNMPPVLDILAEFGETPRAGGTTIGRLTFDGALFTLREAAVGFAAGTLIGLAIAVVLLQSRRGERGVMPYVIASQTVPLIAIAPIVVVWGRTNFGFLPWEWQDWMSVSLIATYLTFFPVAVGSLRGLQSPSPEATELMQSYAASRRQVLTRLQLPASVPFLFPALRIAATASVVGAIVGEISAGVRGGLGRPDPGLRRQVHHRPRAALRVDHRRGPHRPAGGGCGGAGRAGGARPAQAGGGMSNPVVEGGGNVEPNLVVEIAGLDKTFNPDRVNAVAAIAGLDLSVGPREFVSIIGPSGLREEHAAATGGWPDRTYRRHRGGQRKERRRGAPGPGLRDGVPGGRAAGLALGDAQRGVAAGTDGLAEVPPPRPGCRDAGVVELSGFASHHPGNSPGACSSECRSPGHCRSRRRCC